MSRRCERPGCSIVAAVAYGFDTIRSVVWLESLAADEVDAARTGVVCRRHADAMRPPRGWSLDDRRSAMPSLFDEFAAPTPPGPMGSRAGGTSRSRRAVRADSFEQAGFDFESLVHAALVEPAGSAAADAGAVASSVDASAFEAPSSVDASAFEAPSSHDAAIDDAVVGGGRPDVAEPDETRMIPWAPRFDHDDDLGGLLSASSPLLSRAFGRRPPGGAGGGRRRHGGE